MVIKLALCLFGVQAAMVFFLAWNQPEPNLASCRASERIYGSDQSLMLRQKAPTHFPLMPSRYVAMVQAARGDECTGTTAVGFNGRDFVQTGASDDPAIMELVPKLSRWFGMSLANTYDVLILSVISSGILIGYAGFWNLFADRRPRLIGTAVFLCVGVAEARLADEYIFQISPLIAGIPWLIHLGLHGTNRVLTASAVLLAFCCSWCSLIRSGSLVICLTFLVTLFVARHRTQKPFLPLLLIAVACIPSVILARSVVRGRDAALARVHERAKAENSPCILAYAVHWFWIYPKFCSSSLSRWRGGGKSAIDRSDRKLRFTKIPSHPKTRIVEPGKTKTGSGDWHCGRESLHCAPPGSDFAISRAAADFRRTSDVLGRCRFPSHHRDELYECTGSGSQTILFAYFSLPHVSVLFDQAVPEVGAAGYAGRLTGGASYLLMFLCLALLYTSIKLCPGYGPTVVLGYALDKHFHGEIYTEVCLLCFASVEMTIRRSPDFP